MRKYNSMLPLTILSLFLFLPAEMIYAQQDETTLYIIVRHAERQDDELEERMENPSLSQQGLERANRLAGLLERHPVDAVYSTDVKRTRMTVALVAAAGGVDIEFYDWEKQEAFLSEIADTHKGKTVLIAGHSNTIHETANLILGREEFDESFDHDNYSNLLVIVSPAFGTGRLLHLTY